MAGCAMSSPPPQSLEGSFFVRSAPFLRPDLPNCTGRRAQPRSRLAAGHRRRRRAAVLTAASTAPCYPGSGGRRHSPPLTQLLVTTETPRHQIASSRDARLAMTGAIWSKSGLEPTAPFEPQQRQDGAEYDQCKAVGITPRPIQFRHVLEIHAIHTGDQRRRHAHDRNDREDFDDVVLVDVDQPQRAVEQQLDLVEEM